MKLGLTYQDDQAAPSRPLNLEVLRVCRPDFVALEIGSLPELRERIGEIRRARLRATVVLPVERLSGAVITLMARLLDREWTPQIRIVLGARPAARALTPGGFLTKVARACGDLERYPSVAIGVGEAPADWLDETLELLAGSGSLRRHAGNLAVSSFPVGPPSHGAAWRLARTVREALPDAELHVETGWALGPPLPPLAAWRTAWRAWRGTGARLWAWGHRPTNVTPEIRDVWMRDAWAAWLGAGATSLAFNGYVENPSTAAAAWSVISPSLRPATAWRELRTVATLEHGPSVVAGH